MQGFRKFILRGNVVDLAVAVVIGAAFGKIVSSLVDNVIMPPLGVLIGNIDFSDLVIKIGTPVADAKGIITKNGGFLWGLLGSTDVLSGSIDTTQFQPMDKTAEQTIHLQGKVDEILPQRSVDSYTESTDPDQKNSDLQIVEPNKFWQHKYLVVVLD